MEIRDLLTEKHLRNLEEMVAEIDIDELKSKIDNGEIFKLIEVSNLEDYNKGRIGDAIHIPFNHIKDTVENKFKKFHQIVIYCQNSESHVGKVAARLLQRAGFSNTLLLRGGKEAWQNAGLPIVK